MSTNVAVSSAVSQYVQNFTFSPETSAGDGGFWVFPDNVAAQQPYGFLAYASPLYGIPPVVCPATA